MAAMNFEPLLEQAIFHCYRLGGYLMLNVLDDPALLALVFC